MNNKNNGGPAYPTAQGGHGMSLRDWFAGMATEEDIYYQQSIEIDLIKERTGKYPVTLRPLTRSQARYRHADAMLKERDK